MTKVSPPGILGGTKQSKCLAALTRNLEPEGERFAKIVRRASASKRAPLEYGFAATLHGAHEFLCW